MLCPPHCGSSGLLGVGLCLVGVRVGSLGWVMANGAQRIRLLSVAIAAVAARQRGHRIIHFGFCDGRSRSAKGMVTSNHDGNSDAMREIRHVVLIAV